MPVRVQLPDGSIGEFPDGMKDSDIESVLQKQYGSPTGTGPAGLPAGQYLPGVRPPSLPSELQGGPSPPDGTLRSRIQNSFDENTRTTPKDPLLGTLIKSTVGAIGSPFVHPVATAAGILNSIPSSPDLPSIPLKVNGKTYARDPENPLVQRGSQAYTDARDGGIGYSAAKLAGEALGSAALGEAIKLAPGAARDLGNTASKIRSNAIGDPNEAALRGLRIGPASNKAISTLRAVEGARPFVQGVSSLEDLQARIPAAKSEIWNPYENAVNRIGDKPTRLGTIRDLEERRQVVSGQLRLLKSKNPGDIALATQQGLDKAALLSEEKKIQSVLDPALREQGINPVAIRRTYSDVGRIGTRIEGKSTLTENPKPYGFGRLMDIDLHRPSTILRVIPDATKDIVAGRPLWSGKPTDVAIREGFRTGGPKPEFRIRNTPYDAPEPIGLLESSNIAEPGGKDYTGGRIPKRPNIVPLAPASRLGIPASSSAGIVQPMIGVRLTPPPGLAEDYARTRIIEPEYLEPPTIPHRGFIAGPDGTVRGNPLFLNANEPRGLLGVPKKKKK